MAKRKKKVFTKKGSQFKALKDKLDKPKRKRRRRFAPNPASFKSNPPLATDLIAYAIPGFGGFVATKFIANLAAAQIAKRWPQYARHAGAVASIGSFLSAWWLGHKVRWLERWHSPIVVGSAIASAHNLVQLYFPDKLSWIVGSPKQAAIASAVATQQQQQQAIAAQQQAESAAFALPDHLEEVHDDPSWYTFNDAYDAGRYKGTPAAVAAVTAQIENQDPLPVDDEEIGLATGLFADNHFGTGAAAGN